MRRKTYLGGRISSWLVVATIASLPMACDPAPTKSKAGKSRSTHAYRVDPGNGYIYRQTLSDGKVVAENSVQQASLVEEDGKKYWVTPARYGSVRMLAKDQTIGTAKDKPSGEGFFEGFQNNKSKRSVVLKDESGSYYLYMTVPVGTMPVSHALAFTTVPLVTKDEAKAIGMQKKSPPLAKDYAGADPFLKQFRPSDFAFRWTDDGESVAVLFKGNPLAMIVSAKELGYSKAVGKNGPYGKPWDQKIFDATFGK